MDNQSDTEERNVKTPKLTLVPLINMVGFSTVAADPIVENFPLGWKASEATAGLLNLGFLLLFITNRSQLAAIP